MYARKPQTDPMNLPLMPGARTLTSGQPTRLKPPPAPRGPVMSPAQRMATQPERDQAGRVRKYNEELALMNAASPIPFKNTGPDGPLELNQERPDRFAGRATGAFVNSNIGVANTLGQLGLNTANAYGAAFDPAMGGAVAAQEFYRGDSDAPERLATAATQGGYVENSQQAMNDILPSLPIPAATTPGEMLADVTGIGASIFTGFGAPVLKGGKALSETLATVPGMSRTLRGVGVETGENAALAYGVGAGAAPAGSDRNMAGTRSAADPLNYVSIEAARAVPRALKALDAPATPTNAGGANLRQPAPQMPPVAPAVAATQNAQQVPTQPQTATAPPVPPTPPNAPAVTAGAPQPVPARSRAEQRADDLLIKKLAADGITMDDVRKIQARLARRGDSGVYETIGEIAALTDKSSGANLRGLQMAGGAAPGPLQEALVGLVNQNTDKLSPRLSRGATRATGQKADNAVATLDELETRLRTEAAPAYDTAYATPVDPQVFANEIVPVLNTPSGQKALQAARNNLASVAADLQARAARGASERATMESQRAQAAVKSIDDFMADPVRGTAIPTTMALDYTKRAFDDVIANAGFGSDTARIVGGTKRNFADSVSQATGGEYGNALGVFEDVKRLEDAFDVGTQALNKKTWELQRDMAKGRNGSPWTAGEIEALAMGVARNIEDLIEANNQSALTKLLKDKALKNMATALGSQKAADMFEETIRRLGANREWGRRVAGGSDTAMRQAAIRDAGMEGEDAVTRVLDRVETSGNQFSLPGLVNDVAVKPIARTAKDIYQRLRYPGVYDEEVNRALIPLIGKPMTEGNLNEVIRRVEARMAEKGLIPPAQPAAVAAPPPAPRRRPRGPGGSPPGTTSSASATGTGIVAGGVLGAMAPADDENQQLMNALFGAAGGGALGAGAGRLARGSTPKGPPPASGASRPPPVRNGLGGGKPSLPMDEPSRMQRAREQGFDVDNRVYHGSSKSGGFDEFQTSERGRFGPGVYFSEQPGVAGKYGEAKPYVVPTNDQLFDAMPSWNSLSDDVEQRIIKQLKPNEREKLAALKNWYKREGEAFWEALRRSVDGDDKILADARASEVIQAAGFKGIRGIGDGQETVIFNPKNVRSPDAAFDPSETQSSKLLAGVRGQPEAIGAGLGTVFAPDADGDGEVSFGERAGAAITGGVMGRGARAIGNRLGGAGGAKGPPRGRTPDQGTFGGRRGADTLAAKGEKRPQQALDMAEQMAARGASRDEIWDATSKHLEGTPYAGAVAGKHSPDGKARFEIDDSRSTFNEIGNGRDYLTHPDGMFKAYRDVPGMQDLGDVRVMRSGRADEGAFMGSGSPIESLHIGKGSSDPRSIALHEYQHGIQAREGFARGGSPEKMPDLMQQQEEVVALTTKYQSDGMTFKQALEKAKAELSPYAAYRRLAGETEARNVQTRRDMTPEERRARRPWETQDVPDDQQIVRFGGGKAESRPKPPPTGNRLGKPKPPTSGIGRTVAGGAIGGIAGGVVGEAGGQEDLTGKITATEQTIADLKKAMADLDKITDPFEKQRFLKAQGYYAGKIDGSIMGKTTEGMERWKAKKEAELEKAEAERKDLVRRDALQSNRPDPLMMALREYGPAVLGIGALFGMKYMRGGAAKASIQTAEAASNKLNKLITKGPVTGALNKRDENRFSNLNKLWQKGGASKDELPFKQDSVGNYKPNAKAKLPEELFADSGVWQTVTKYVKGKDVAIILGGGLDVAIAQPFIDKANENLTKAEAAWNDTPSDETAKALEDAKNEVAAYTLLQRIGMGVAAGRILGTFGGAYAKPMPNIPGAASEQAKLKQFIAGRKPPPKPRTPRRPPPPQPTPAGPTTGLGGPTQLPLPLKGGGKKKP
jgi:hypothetical protein